VRGWLHEDLPIGPVLRSFCDPRWTEIAPGGSFDLAAPSGAALHVRVFETGRHAPRFASRGGREHEGAVVGLEIRDPLTGGRLIWAPCAAGDDADLMEAARTA